MATEKTVEIRNGESIDATSQIAEYTGPVFTETLRDGSKRSQPGILLRNNTQNAVRLGFDPATRIEREPVQYRATHRPYRPARYLQVVIEPDEEWIAPIDLMWWLQDTRCSHTACINRPLACRNENHVDWWLCGGGAAAMLTRVSAGKVVKTHPVLSGEPNIPAPDPAAIQDLNARIAARLAARKAVRP